MAGNNLSPRQKMINMMYLVLTALLALNITSEVLQGFESLRLSLETSMLNLAQQNQSTAESARRIIQGDQAEGLHHHDHLLPYIDEIQKESGALLVYLNQVSEALEKIGERKEGTREIENKGELDANYVYWMGADDALNGGRGAGEAANLRQKLMLFQQWANAMLKKVDTSGRLAAFSPMVIEPSDDPNITDPESKNKVWEYHSFHNKPIVADLAFVEKFKLDVKEKESVLLNLILEQARGQVYKIDKLRAMDAPVATVIPAGLPFETRLMVGMYSDAVKPQFSGSGITVDEGGSTATMKMTADASVIPAGANEGIQRYRAMIRVPKANGTFEELPIEGQFIVRRPEIVVSSKTVNMLYRDCANNLEVDVPALGDLYNPDFSHSSGGTASKGRGRKDVMVVTSGKEFTLSVYSNTNGQSVKIGDRKYGVVNPPKPRMRLTTVGGKELEGIQSVGNRETVIAKIEPDKEFLESHRQDARYTGTVKLMYQMSPLIPPVTIATRSGDLNAGVKFELYQGDLRNATQGARIFVEIEDFKRVNFQNKKVDVPGMARVDLIRSATIR